MLERLEASLKAAAIPFIGVRKLPGPTAEVVYSEAATGEQQKIGNGIAAAFDWSPQAHNAWLEDQQPERKGLRQAAANAVLDNEAFLAIASPSPAQVGAQVRRLTQQMNRVIPRLIQLD